MADEITEVFLELPILVIHDTVISDVLGENKATKYKESAIFVTNYLILRQAFIGMGSEKSGVTTKQVFNIFEDLSSDKTNTFKAIRGWVDETTFTEKLPLGVRSSVYVYAHFISRRAIRISGRRVILVCNDDKIEEKLIAFYQESPFAIKEIKNLPFAVMNTDELKEYLKNNDKKFFEFIEDKL